MYHSHDMAMGNGQIMFIYIYIYIEHRNLEIWKTHNDFSVQVRNFLLPLSLKVLRHKERDMHSFYSGFFICPPPQSHVATATKATGLALVSKRKPTLLVRCLVSTLLSDFFKISPNPPCASGVWCHPHSVTLFPIWAIVTSLSDTSAPPTRVNTCVNVAPK